METELRSWLPHWKPGKTDDRVQLFCFPYAGAGPSIFRQWHVALASVADTLPVSLPGRESRLRDKAFDDVRAAAAAIVVALLPAVGERFALFGHSYGALIAYELAHALERLGRVASVLIVSGCAPPALRTPPARSMRSLDDDEFVEMLLRIGATPQEVIEDRSLLDLFLPTLRADFEAATSYHEKHARRLGCPIVAMAGDRDPGVSELMPAWVSHTSSAFELHRVAGDHFFVQSREHETIEVVRAALTRCAGRPDAARSHDERRVTSNEILRPR
jgi:medium-chain acyl-[acyl-carrier-protein] hydrolase